MPDDAELLRRYAEKGAEDAFAELARRHLDLVYSVALRQTGGNAHLAEDITQMVFIDLARKAGQLPGRTVIVGWLHTATRYAVATVLRSERNRQAREIAALSLEEPSADSSHGTNWEALRPVIDDALGSLRESDRAAVLLRFFQGKSYAAIGQELALTETAARSRVDRAIDRLRTQLARRGITSTTTALAATLAHGGTTLAPTEITAAAIVAALAAGKLTPALAPILAATRLGKLAALTADFAAMKFATTLLALSLAANATLGFTYFNARQDSGTGKMTLPAAKAEAPVGNIPVVATSPVAVSPPTLVNHKDPRLADPRNVAQRMLGEGYPDEAIYRAVLTAIQLRDTPPSQDLRTRWRQNPATLAAVQQSANSASAQRREASELTGVVSLPDRLKYGDLSAEKLTALQEIEADFSNMGTHYQAIHAVNGTSGGQAIRASAETTAQVQQEREAAVRQILSPDEATEYLRGTTDTTAGPTGIGHLRSSMEGLEIDGPTYVALADATLSAQLQSSTGTDLFSRLQEQTELYRRYRNLLGDEKFMRAAPKLDHISSDLDAVIRSTGLLPSTRANLFFQVREAFVGAQYGPVATRAADAAEAYTLLTAGAGLLPERIAAFDQTTLGKLLKATAQGNLP